MYFLPFFWWFFSSQLSYKINKGFCKISDCFESYHSQFDGDCAWRKVSNVAFSVFHFVLYFTCLFPKNNSVWNQFHQFYFIFFSREMNRYGRHICDAELLAKELWSQKICTHDNERHIWRCGRQYYHHLLD